MSGFLSISGHVWQVQYAKWLQGQGGGGQVTTIGGDFWYDASQPRYFIWSTTPSSGGTTNGWISKFSSGVVVPAAGFYPYPAGYNLPNPYYTGNATGINTVGTFTGSISNLNTTTFSGSIVPGGAYNTTGTLNVTSAPSGNGIAIGSVLTGTGVTVGTYVVSNISGLGTVGTSSWLVSTVVGSALSTVTNITMTATQATLNISTVTSGVMSIGNVLYKATGGPATNTFIIGNNSTNPALTGNGGTGTYLVNVTQNYASASAILAQMPFVGFNSGDAFRIPMGGDDRTLAGYTMFIAAKVTGAHLVGNFSICGSSHVGGDFTINTTASTWSYNVAGTTATGVATTGNWLIHSMVFDGTQPTNATKFRAWINGAQSTLTFAGNVGTTTIAPKTITTSTTSATWTNSNFTVFYGTNTGSPMFVAGDTLTFSGWTTNPSSSISGTTGTLTVTACSLTAVTVSLPGSGGIVARGTISGTPIPNLMISGKAPMTASKTNTNPATVSSLGLELGEIIVYKGAVDDITRQATEKYMRQKWLGTN